MFPYNPIVDLSSIGIDCDAEIKMFFIIYTGWCFGWSLYYAYRKYMPDVLAAVIFILLIMPIANVMYFRGLMFWGCVIMIVLNFVIWTCISRNTKKQLEKKLI